MISTLTSLLSRAEASGPETEASDEGTRGSADGAERAAAPDLAVVEPEPSPDPDTDGAPPRDASGEDDARRENADPDPDTDWEFISGMVDQAMDTEAAVEPASEPAGTSGSSETADTATAETGPTPAEPGETVGAGPFAGVPLADLDAAPPPLVETEARNGTADETRTDDGAVGENPAAAAGGEDSVLEALVDELETADLSSADRATVREALGVESPESVRVRLAHLQSDVADLRAYADAMERVLEEENEADRLARDLGRRIDGLRDRLDETITALEGDLAAETEARKADVDRLETRIDGVATTLTDSVMALHHDVEALRDEVETNRAWREDVTAAFANAED